MSSRNSAGTPATTLLDRHGLEDVLGLKLSVATIYRMVADGRLPKPIRTSSGRTSKRFWRRAEVEAAVAHWPSEIAPQRPAA